jgi:NADH dehydrogenase FAD-containing subunit
MISMNEPPITPVDGNRVVIVGGGSGSINAARGLRRAPVDVVLVDRRNFNVFSPMPYQAATGAVGRREVLLSDGTPLGYDTLVVATGTQYA